MKAAVLHKGEERLRVEEVEDPKPGPGEVRVKVVCCGVCGSDVHVTVHKVMALKNYPRIMGHEASGEILEVGEGVDKYKTGDRVVIMAGTACGKCKECLAGRDNACPEVGVLGFDSDGAYAEQIVVKERFLTPLPDSVPWDQGAIMADAVSTPYHAVKYMGRFEEGEKLAVFGCGGLGIHAVMIGKALGASQVIAMDVDDGALQNAGMLGADEVINVRGLKNPGKTLKELTGGVDVVADFSGYFKNVEFALRAMNARGRIVMVGLGKGKIEIPMPPVMIYRQLCICGSYGCERGAVSEIMELHKSGKLDLSKSITSHHPLEEVNDCLENLYHRQGNPIRYIIKPNS